MWEILSLARHTFRESLRKKVMLVVGLFVVVVLVSTELAPAGYPEAKPTLALSAALKGMAIFGLVTVVFLAATSIPDDIHKRTIYSLLAKPLPRWKLLVGRILGFVFVATALVLVMGLFSWAFIRYTGRRYLSRAQQREVLVGRRFLRAQALQVLRGGQVQEVAPTAEGRVWVHGELEVVARYTFFNVRPKGIWGKAVHGELKFLSNSRGMGVLPGVLTVTNPTTGESEDLSVLYVDHKITPFSFSPGLVDDLGSVLVEVRRTAEGDALGVLPEDLRVRLRPVSFEWNLVKALLLLLLGLMVAAALAVMGSTVLSPMVSICFGFFVCFLGNIVVGMRSIAATLTHSGTALLDMYPQTYQLAAEGPPPWVVMVNQSVRYLLTGLSLVVPDFRKFYAADFLIEGINVHARFLGWAALYSALYTGGALVLAWLLFRRREMT